MNANAEAKTVTDFANIIHHMALLKKFQKKFLSVFEDCFNCITLPTQTAQLNIINFNKAVIYEFHAALHGKNIPPRI